MPGILGSGLKILPSMCLLLSLLSDPSRTVDTRPALVSGVLFNTKRALGGPTRFIITEFALHNNKCIRLRRNTYIK